MEHDAAIIEVGLNEAISPAVHRHVPQRPLECAADARRCARRGGDDRALACRRRRRANSVSPTRRCTGQPSTRSTAACSDTRRTRSTFPTPSTTGSRHCLDTASAARDGDRARRCRVGQHRRGRRGRARGRTARARARLRRHPQLAAVRRRRARELPRRGAGRDGRRVRPRLDPRDRRARAGRAPRPAGAVQDLPVGVAADRSPSRVSKPSISTSASSRPTSTSSGSSSPTG